MKARVGAILLGAGMSRFVAIIGLFVCSSAMAITYYQLNDGITMTEETIGDVTYYRTSEGDNFTSISLNDSQNLQNDIYKDYLNKKSSPKKIDSTDVLRFWRDKSGNQVLARFIQKSGTLVILEFEDGSRKSLPMDGLSALDQEYIAHNALPSIKLDVGKIQINNGTFESVRFKAKAKYNSSYDFPWGINLHLFVFSESDELIRHEHRDNIEFDEKKRFEFETSAFTFLKSSARNADESRQYGGYLLIATDSRNRIISTRYTNDKAKKKLDMLVQYGIKKIQIDKQLPFRELSPYSPSSRL